MRSWVVGGAVIEAGPSLLLVENLRANGTTDWTPPGGVIDEGEPLVEGLTREVNEETGLHIVEWAGPLYEIQAEAPGLGWTLRVEVHRALVIEGDLTVGADPDGIVVGAEWVAGTECEGRLCDAHPWVREPLVEWVTERWDTTRSFRYRIEGTRLDGLEILRL